MGLAKVELVALGRAQGGVLLAALAACAREPTEKDVHHLRTATRRFEAVLDLLEEQGKAVYSKRRGRKLRRRMRRVFRRAGSVRDCDVQLKLMRNHLPADAVFSASINASSKAVYAALGKRRRKAGARLSATLAERAGKVVAAVEGFLGALPDDGSTGMPGERVVAFARERFAASHAMQMRSPSAVQMHGIRKAAKAARYVIQLVDGGSTAGVAGEFQELQRLGGVWHDYHMFAATVEELLGEDDALAGVFAHLADRHREAFEAGLEGYRGGRE